MRTIASVAAIVCTLTFAAQAQTTTSPGTGSTKMSQAECSSSWTRLDSAKTGKVSETQAKSDVTNFSAADTDKDGNLTQSEFMSACDKGLVTASGQTGTGSRGMSGDDLKTQTPSTAPSGTTK